MKVATSGRACRGRSRSILAGTALAWLCACGGGGSDAAEAAGANAGAAPRALALSTTAYQVTSKDKFAVAYYFENSPCVSTGLQVFANEHRGRAGAAPSLSDAYVSAQLVEVDWCLGGVETVLTGRQDTKASQFRHDLSQATAVATIEVSDGASNRKTLAVDLAWNGGELTSDESKGIIVTPVSRSFLKIDNQFRVSEAITGSLVLDGVDLLAPGRPGSSYIQGYVVNAGSVTVQITRSP